MKKLSTFLALLPAIFIISWMPASNEITTIRWTSTQYKDLETGDMIRMTNEFECTPEGLSWSLFDGAMPVNEVEWMLNEDEKGFIRYHISSNDLNGTVTFYLGTALRAETDLKSDVGQLRFKFHFTKEQVAFSFEESYASMIDNNH